MSWRLLLVILLATGVHAETYVIAAGVETYDDQRIASLGYAVADAKSIAASFRASGVPRQNVTLLVSGDPQPERRPTRVALLTALDTVREKAHPGDRLVFFFAGHGIEEGGEQYLLTSDTRRSLLKATALPTSLINAALSGIRAHELLFLIDACRNNPNASRGDEGAQLTEGLIRGIQPEPRPDATEPPVVATLLSCDVGQRAYEEPTAGHGVFTVFLLKGLAGAASSEDGQVRLLSLAAYVQRAIEEWCAQTRRAQRPRLVNPDNRDMVLLRPPSEPLVSVSFRGTRLADATTQLAEDYGVQIVLGKGANPEVKVTGHLENQPLSVVLKVLLLAYDLTLRRQGTIYIIEEAGAAPEPVQPPPPAVEQPEGFDGPTITVAQDGSGQYKTIQAAVDAAPEGAVIRIGAGTYREAVRVPKRLCLLGEGRRDQVVLNGDGQSSLVFKSQGCAMRGLTVDTQRGSAQRDWFFGVSAPAGFRAEDCAFGLSGGSKDDVALVIQARQDLAGQETVVIKRCHFSAGESMGLILRDGACQVQDCSFSDAGYGAMVCKDIGASFVSCQFDAGLAALHCSGGSHVEVLQSRLQGAALAVFIGSGSDVKLLGCNLRGGPVAALQCQDAGSRLRVEQCRVGGTEGVALLLTGGADAEFTNNRLAFPGSPFRSEYTGLLVENDNVSVPLDQLEQDDAAVPVADFPGPTITVAQDGSGQYQTIAEAVAAAPDGATIRIGPGTYREDPIDLKRRVALVGTAGQAETMIQPLSTAEHANLCVVQADGCRLDNLTFDGAGTASGGFAVWSAGCTFQDCRFVGWTQQVIGVQAPGSSATLSRCAITGTSWWAVQVTRGTVLLDGCTLEDNGRIGPGRGFAQVLVNAGGRVTAQRCHFKGGWAGLAVLAGGCAELDDCDLLGAEANGFDVYADADRVSVRNCRLMRNDRTGFALRPQGGDWRRDSATGEWKYGTDAEKLPLPPQNAHVEVTGCDLRGNAWGAFSGEWAGRLTLSGNTYDTGDKTVPKDQAAAAPPVADFTGPTITVAQDGSGQYKTIQAAVDAAPEGATIRIAPGTYHEGPIDFYRRVALVGIAGAAETVVQPASNAESVSLYLLKADGCQLSNLTFDGAGTANGGFAVWRGGSTFLDCRFVGWTKPVIGVDLPGRSAMLSRCAIVGTTWWAVEVKHEGTVLLDDCALENNGRRGAGLGSAQVLVSTGGRLVVRRCRITGGWAGLAAFAEGMVELDDCDLLGAEASGLDVYTDAGKVSVRNSRLMRQGETGLAIRPQIGDLRRDPATGDWKYGDDAEKLPLLPQNARVEVTGCDLRGNAKGAFGGELAGRLMLSNNTYDPGDNTVPKDVVSQTATGEPFNGPKPTGWPDDLLWPIPGVTNPDLRFRVCDKDGMPQVLIPAGEFLMGSPPNEKDRGSDEGPQKRVYISDFWMDLHEVTVGQYKKFCQTTGRQVDDEWRKRNTNDLHPVVSVSWDDATAYAQWAGRELPTEAQWEKAARGGTTTAYPWGDRWDESKANNNQQGTTPVGSYAPNGFGLFDMIGNVWEWCRDWHDEGWYAKMPARDPVNKTKAAYSVLRGGSWLLDPWTLRPANRLRSAPVERPFNTGFRCSAAP